MYSKLSQRLNAWSVYRKKYERINPDVDTVISHVRAFIELRLTSRNGKDTDKVHQLEKLFSESKVINKGYGDFFYSLDERCVPLSAGKVIGNMPIDYSFVVDHSFAELTEENLRINNNISRQNLEMISVISNYVKVLLPRIDNDLTKSYIERLFDDKADSLEEALQRVLFVNQLLWQSKHTLMGFGRIDKILDRFQVTESSKYILKNFIKTLHEFYNFKSNSLLGDTGQIFILGGVEEDGSYFCNQYTYLFIDCIKELGLPDPKVLLRVGKNTPEDLLEKAAECIATGVGSPLLSNDDVVVPALIDFGYSREDSYNYGTSACWEPLVIGKSLEQNNIASIVYGRALYNTISDEGFVKLHSFDEVLSLFYHYLMDEVGNAKKTIDKIDWEYDPLLTLFTHGCLESNLDISKGGAIYNNYGLLTEGLSSAVNSLLNIKKFCFEKKQIKLEIVKDCLNNDYVGYDTEKDLLSENTDGFGTSSEEAIKLTNDIINHTIELLQDYRNMFGGKAKFGLSSPNYVKNGLKVGATLDGRQANTPFATHISREKGDPITEIANFASKLQYSGFNANANVIDVIVQPNLIVDNIDKFILYLKSIIKMGIFQIQFNVLSYEKLVDAKAHPEKYPSLIVRVWGFSAYFKDLPETYQNQLIKRAKEMERV